MERLQPEAGDVDLAAAYAYPDEGRWLRANMISTVDGAGWHDGKTESLGSSADKRLFSLLRGLADVVLIGAGTVRIEGYGPVKAAEHWSDIRSGRTPVPPLAIVSRALEFNPDAPIFSEALVRTIVLTTEDAPDDRMAAVSKNADVIQAGVGDVDLTAAADALAERGHRRMLCEGGPRLLAQVAKAGLLNELCLTVSPVYVAGDPARIMNGEKLDAPGRLRLADALAEDDFLFLRYLAADA